MTETIRHELPKTDAEADDPVIEQLEGQFTPENDTTDDRELSPFGEKIAAAADRVKTRLENRAITKAHGEALKEDQQRTIDAQNEAFASYEGNIAYSQDVDEAYRINDKFDARAARREKIDDAKDKVRGAGRRALGFLKNAGMLTLGAGVLAGEYGARKAKSGAETASLYALETKDYLASGVKSGVESAALGALYAKDKVAEKASTAMDKTEQFAGKVGAKMEAGVETSIAAVSNAVESGKQWVADNKEMAGDMVQSIRERLARRKEAALGRKYARHAKWMRIKQTMRDRISDVKDASRERVEKTKWNARATRTAGRIALQGFKETRDTLRR